MVTGDTLAAARAVSRQVGLGDRFSEAVNDVTDPLQYDGFAHCYPQDKFQLVQSLQRAGRIVGMTGDGVNDAPALKQAEVGIAVSTATDVAKASAQVVLTRSGLRDMIAVVLGGRRVYRRMLTWTITKIVRTVELAALLAIGYVVTGFFVTSLFLIAVLVVLNDVVTITLATDRAWISPVPERWNVNAVAQIAALYAAAWLALAFALLWVALHALALTIPQVQTLMFVYLIYSAQTTIYLTRTRDRFWSFAPSRYVAMATLGNAGIASVLAYFGILTTSVPALILVGTLVSVLAVTLLLDEIKILVFRRTAIFGKATRAVGGAAMW
jgi:H+-transporting ATPase